MRAVAASRFAHAAHHNRKDVGQMAMDAKAAASRDLVLDARDLACPLPVLKANRILREMSPGERLRILATDRASVADFQAFCRETGHALVAFSEADGGALSFVVRRGP
jgi:tRNA 2-thiouridine synthesizing protein A